MRRILVLLFGLAALPVAMLASNGSAEACAGLIGSNGAVNLGRTTTLAGYHDGVEHYVTAFQFQGGGGEFGTLIPLPGVPSNVEKGGAWTLQRLIRETNPPPAQEARAENDLAFAAGAQVLQEVRIDALDITVLKGGGADVSLWAKDHGFRLSPDAPEVLDFYAERSPIFLAAVFDGEAAAERGQALGDGTPVHITIPTPNPWVPLRILALGKQPEDLVEADVYLLTDDVPALLPETAGAMNLTYSEKASDLLLSDLRSDEGMGWVPESAWLTKLEIDAPASAMSFDLAVDASGQGQPSRRMAGLELDIPTSLALAEEDGGVEPAAWLAIAASVAALVVLVAMQRQRSQGDAS